MPPTINGQTVRDLLDDYAGRFRVLNKCTKYNCDEYCQTCEADKEEMENIIKYIEAVITYKELLNPKKNDTSMTRAIKFRAWDKHLSRMRTVESIDFDSGIVCFNDSGMYKTNYGQFLLYEKSDSEINTVLIQFTGLLDKNGKEIYEGDIVVWHDNSENIDKGWSGTAIVRINPDLYFECFKVGEKQHNIDFHYDNFIWKETEKYFEVIGNIYSNPELLTK